MPLLPQALKVSAVSVPKRKVLFMQGMRAVPYRSIAATVSFKFGLNKSFGAYQLLLAYAMRIEKGPLANKRPFLISKSSVD
jgi:hypothetical protein